MNRTSTGWPNVPLTEVLDFQEGPGIMARDFHPEGVPLIRLAGLKRGAPLLTGCDFLDGEKVSQRWAHFRLQQGDVLLSTSASLGETATVDVSGEGAIAYTGIIRFRPKGDKILGRFIPHALTAPSFKRQIEAVGGGSVIKHFGPTHLRQMTVCVPPLREQQAIAEVLGSLDDKIAVNERIAATSLALGDGLHEILQRTSEGAPASAIADLTTGEHLRLGDGYRTKRSEYGTPGLPILRVAEVGDGQITPAFGDSVREEFRPAMGGKVSAPGDVVLTTKGTVGRVAMISPAHPEFVYSPQVCYFRVTAGSAVSRFYLFHWFRSKEFWRQANGMKRQTDMADYLSLRDVKSLRMVIPPRELMAEFDKKCTALYARLEAARSENRTLADLRNTLLPQLVTGKIRVKDAARVMEDVAS
nr:restriction endonuclease subunit S [Streptomyces venezuelae]